LTKSMENTLILPFFTIYNRINPDYTPFLLPYTTKKRP